ncbi:MAG: hypothetical protein HY868_02850 [Chloroflexi bacterium]|nr:hypothetical protein [Chloroflexota bacterium]
MLPGGVENHFSLRVFAVQFILSVLAACGNFPTTTSPALDSNFDAETRTLIANAERVVFVIPFSHWDTDWHENFADYVKRSDQNILTAIQMAKAHPRFRYTLEQVLFVQHFWDHYPQQRADLKALVQRGQISFAWAGITQPETSLVAPAIQVRNLQLGQDWIAEKFGREYVPRTAWQSDAFGTVALFPAFLAQADIPYLYIGRGPARCDPNDPNCGPLPRAFFWRTPASNARIVVASGFYANAWGAVYRFDDEQQQLAALGEFLDGEFARTNSKYVLVPWGFDFLDPTANVPTLVEHWNAKNPRTLIVMSDPETAFEYLATQPLAEINLDLNPLWQAFYATRPYAKIADKESEFYLTAGDKFGTLVNAPQTSAWYTATINAHYDNISGVSFDSVWETTQRPRYEQTVATAANDLASTLARIASGIESPIVIFNPTSWQRSEIIELQGSYPDPNRLPAPVQRINADTIAFRANAIPGIGFAVPTTNAQAIEHPARISRSGDRVMLTNGLVTVTLDAAHGGTFAHLSAGDTNLLSAFGDDVTFIDDSGDVYGARFGSERARESQVLAQITTLAEGPLLARAQVNFALGGKPITKTVTLRADSPLVEVNLQIAALAETTAIAQTPTTLAAQTRTDDLGFGAFNHPMDNRPIVAGDITYRRKIFYPIIAWGDVSSNDAGLTLITHGLQGLGGTSTLNLMLVREVTKDDEGVTDSDYHTLRYAYLPHVGQIDVGQVGNLSYGFNQPLIPVWRASGMLNVQLPFEDRVRQFPIARNAPRQPNSLTIISAQSGIVADLFRRDGQTQVLALDYDPATATTLTFGDKQITLPVNGYRLMPIVLR